MHLLVNAFWKLSLLIEVGVILNEDINDGMTIRVKPGPGGERECSQSTLGSCKQSEVRSEVRRTDLFEVDKLLVGSLRRNPKPQAQ